MVDPLPAGGQSRVTYVLKGYPRLSELFIASEIWRLERRGVQVGIVVCKPAEETWAHPIVADIVAPVRRLPLVPSLSGRTFPSWLRDGLPPALPALRWAVRHHPLGLTRATARAAAQSWRARTGWRPRAIYAKELLWAVCVAAEAGGTGHLHAHFAHGTTTVTWLAATILGVPFSFTGHAKDIYRQSLNPAGLLARKLHAAAFAVTCTAANVNHLRAVAPGARIHLAYHGLNAQFAALVDGPHHVESVDTFAILSVGRLVPKKGFDVLLDAVAELLDRGQPVCLVIAGEDGPEAPGLHDQIMGLGLADHVRFIGTVSQVELLAELRRSSVFALACRVDADGDRDGIPNVLVEAMAAGIPVVSTAVSGIPELIADDDNGLLVPPEDPHALAECLLRLAKDPVLRDRLSAAGRRTVADRFDGDALAAGLAALFMGNHR